MIKIENTEVVGWDAAIRGMRNPLNSWAKSDSEYTTCGIESTEEPQTVEFDMLDFSYKIGPNDHNLMIRLCDAGEEHRKFMRMIVVYTDITAPLYWLAELDTYKVGTVRNSCSFMHKGVSKPFDIFDFSLKDDRIYSVLGDLSKKEYTLIYPYETDEYRRFTDDNGRTYRVYKNGRVIRESFSYIDNFGSGRKRTFDESEATIYQNKEGYFIVKFSGRNAKRIPLHRLIATCWIPKPIDATQVNHINGNKGDNSVENLEWTTASENMQKGIESGLFENLNSLHRKYLIWKNNSLLDPETRFLFMKDIDAGYTHKELAEKYNISPSQANSIRYVMKHSENEDLFQECLIWDNLINCLNSLRDLYLETKDNKIFQEIRSLLPQGYMQRSTFMFNYEVLYKIYNQREGHKLDEWHEFRKWIENLPYSELITG